MARTKKVPVFAATIALAILGAAAQGLGAGAGSSGPGAKDLRYSVAIQPQRPTVGSIVVFELRVEGLSASSARVDELGLDRGLSLESQSIRPIAEARGAEAGPSPVSARGVAFRFELRVLEPGERRIDYLRVAASDGSLKLGPILVGDALERGDASVGGAGQPPERSQWRWVAPSEALRYQAFEARLERADGEGAEGRGGGLSASDPEPSASFLAPPGTTFEPSGKLSWTVIAFEEGELDLPEASLGRGPGRSLGSAKSSRITIRALPADIASSRAMGSFALSIKAPGRAATGSELRLALVLEGRGNLPALIFPEPRLDLAGKALPKGTWTSSRVDEARAEGGTYVGSSSLLIDLVPPRSGLLSLSFPPLPVLDPRSGLASLSLPPLEIRVEGEATPPAQTSKARSVAGGQALAELYGSLRRAPALSREAREAKKAALARASELGTDPPLLDALPPPGYFAWPAFFVASAGLALFIVSRGRARDARAREARQGGSRGKAWRGIALPIALVVLALGFGAFGLASWSERKESFAVVWADSIRAVPSARSEHPVAIVKGSTGRTRGFSGGFVSVTLSDGVEGWASRDSVFWY